MALELLSNVADVRASFELAPQPNHEQWVMYQMQLWSYNTMDIGYVDGLRLGFTKRVPSQFGTEVMVVADYACYQYTLYYDQKNRFSRMYRTVKM